LIKSNNLKVNQKDQNKVKLIKEDLKNIVTDQSKWMSKDNY